MLVIFFCAITAVLASNCTFSTEQGSKYDLAVLNRNGSYYTVRDTTYESAFFAVAYSKLN